MNGSATTRPSVETSERRCQRYAAPMQRTSRVGGKVIEIPEYHYIGIGPKLAECEIPALDPELTRCQRSRAQSPTGCQRQARRIFQTAGRARTSPATP
jgi:hypothetical protein